MSLHYETMYVKIFPAKQTRKLLAALMIAKGEIDKTKKNHTISMP
jgi:hypothetical protein